MSITRLNIVEHLIEYQFNMIDKTVKDAENDDMWLFNWKITEEQYKQFRGYAIPLLKKVFKINRTKAEGIFDWFHLNFGLKYDS